MIYRTGAAGRHIRNDAKSILGYPGGKSKAAGLICSFFPPSTKRLMSPFFGGGSVELLAASRGIRVRGYDAFGPLVNFWRQVKCSPSELADRVYEMANARPMDAAHFGRLKSDYYVTRDPVTQAAMFFVINQSSYGALGLSGSFSMPRWQVFHDSESRIDRLGNFSMPNISVEEGDFRDTIPAAGDDLVYADPPYHNEKTRLCYGRNGDMHRNFDHAAFRDVITAQKNWIVSYDDCPETRRAFAGYRMERPQWRYTIRHGLAAAESREVLIFSDAVWKAHVDGSLLAYCARR